MKKMVVVFLTFALLLSRSCLSKENAPLDVSNLSTDKLYEVAAQIDDFQTLSPILRLTSYPLAHSG